MNQERTRYFFDFSQQFEIHNVPAILNGMGLLQSKAAELPTTPLRTPNVNGNGNGNGNEQSASRRTPIKTDDSADK
jgi:hypothetical protein